MAVSRALFSDAKEGGTDDWGTDQEFFNHVDKEFQFTLDVCALPVNAKCPNFFTPEDNGLVQRWAPHICWMNPPYSENIKWIMYAERESRRGAVVAALVPSRTDTEWWHNGGKFARYILFIEGRLTFVTEVPEFDSSMPKHLIEEMSTTNTAPFPSVMLVYCKAPLPDKHLYCLEDRGHLIDQSYRLSKRGLYLRKDEYYDIDEEESCLNNC